MSMPCIWVQEMRDREETGMTWQERWGYTGEPECECEDWWGVGQYCDTCREEAFKSTGKIFPRGTKKEEL